MDIISKNINNYESKKESLVQIYKFCPLSKKCFLESKQIDLHHLYSQHTIVNHFSKSTDFNIGMRGFIHSILNIVPVDHDSHIQGVKQLQWDIKDYKKIVSYLEENIDFIDDINFINSNINAVETALIIFENLNLNPYWFEKFR